jgi:hypothetical protein
MEFFTPPYAFTKLKHRDDVYHLLVDILFIYLFELLTTLSVARLYSVEWMNCNLESIWKEAVVA